MAKKKSKFEKQIKKMSMGSKVVLALALLAGVALSAFATHFVTKNDKFELLGETEITLKLNDVYVEENATCIAFGKDISSLVKIDGVVDTSIEGTYILEYTVDNFRFSRHTLYRKIVVEV